MSKSAQSEKIIQKNGSSKYGASKSQIKKFSKKDKDLTHDHSQQDIDICTSCIELMKETAESCRTWSKQTTSQICRGGLSTSAFVCDSLASSMKNCMERMNKH